MFEWLQTHSGVISAPVLRQLGCPPRTVDRLVSRGDLLLILPGVYRSAHWPFGREQQIMACCLRNPQAIIGFTSAAQLWKMRGTPDLGLHVLIPHGCSPELEGIHIHRCRRIDHVDVVVRSDGTRLTSPPRTVFDSADMLGPECTTSIVEQLLDERRCTFATLNDTATRLAHPRRPGSRTFVEVMRSRPAWRTALQSDLEVRVLAALRLHRLPEPASQYEHRLPDGSPIRIDFAWPRWKVALEVDHPFWHAGARQSQLDKTRDRGLATQGWVSIRITAADVRTELGRAIADVSAVLNQRGWSGVRRAA
jgi:very-short-patch-repair endonuclease